MKIVKPIVTMMLAVLVMISSTSFMIGYHVCMGKVQNVAFFTKAQPCEKEQSLPPCHRHLKPQCCNDETIVHKADDLKVSANHIHLDLPAPAAIEQPFLLISEIIPAAPLVRVPYCNYDPPLRCPDLTIEHQVFLI